MILNVEIERLNEELERNYTTIKELMERETRAYDYIRQLEGDDAA